MSTNSTGGPEWSGDMLDGPNGPEMMDALCAQLRRGASEYADFVARIRRDAEALWAANPPPEYGPVEARRRHRKLTARFARIQRRLELAAKDTFELSAQFRRQRYDVPAARRAAAEAKQEAATLSRGASPHRLNGGGQPYPPRSSRRQATRADGGSFMDMIADRQDRSA